MTEMPENMDDLHELIPKLDPAQLDDLIERLPSEVVEQLVDELGMRRQFTVLPTTPIEQAQEIMPDFVVRDHLRYLSNRLTAAVKSVENGGNPRIIVEMPPRSGKSLLATQVMSGWALATHPKWHIVMASYSSQLAITWSRQVRRWAQAGMLGDLKVTRDAGAAAHWNTTEGGQIIGRSLNEGITGFGAKLLVIDDPHKDFADAHSAASREAVWNWWLSTSSSRLTPQSIVLVIMTRWHEDDLVGRLLSREYPGDPDEWEVIRFPALAEDNDILGREPGEPLLSPLDPSEDIPAALERWERVKRTVGSYVWSALYQQRPSPATGAMLKLDWFRYWTTDPELADPLLADGTVDPNAKTVLLDPHTLAGGSWVDSWDMSFKGEENSDYTVGQRWVKHRANRYLVAQVRDRMAFPQALAQMRTWAGRDPATSPYGQHVHTRLVEDSANGPATISTLKGEIAGLKPVTARYSKEQRVRSVTPEIESGNVYLPHPATPGFGWVNDLISELREFPNGAHDDQADAMSQALFYLRDAGAGGITMPGESNRMTGLAQPGESLRSPRGYGQVGGDRVAAAHTMRRL